ncbi:gephyrin-like molybdotransferase receptor GlpR [Mycobacterium neumannii]|uniref:divisome protein SepX/GlpR n=1 Tax=Mycobacterium neumannii TaxID=2048551 RepID=UPI003AB1C2D7
MPSIPQSLLWISLVVLWLFVLVPMLISKRDTVRRTSDVALSTRVLNSGRNARLLKRRGPAAGHASDPDWRPSEEELDEEIQAEPESVSSRAVVRAAAVAVEEKTEPDYLDVDVIGEDSGALPVGVSDRPEAEKEELTLQFDEPTDEAVDEAAVEEQVEPEDIDADADDEYETVDDSSGLEAPSEADLRMADSLSEARRRRHESKTAAAVSERKYRFRKRMLTTLGVLSVASAAAAFTLSPTLWWLCGAVSGLTVLYLGYLRRQTRIEERLRRRRAQRIARSRLGVENTDDREFDVVPARLRRPGSVVLEIDDEDPIFEHLDYAPFARHFDLPRAAGQ